MSLPRYPQYKDSGVEWLGRVPAHWSVSPLKRHMVLLTEKAEGRRWPVALENVESWSGRFVPTEGDFQGDGVAFAASDILFGKLRPYLAKVFLAAHDGEAVGDFHVVRPGGTLFPRYAQYQMLQRQFIDVVDGSTFGSKMPRASWESLGGMPLVVPEYEEQRSIAFFLDRETAKIDALIAEQEKLLALLAEKRQATISHAVTRGLDPNAPMKDSGIPWLGEVPAHWRVSRVRNVCESINTGPFGTALGNEDYVEGGVPVINPSHIVDSRISPDPRVSVSHETAERLEYWALRRQDIVAARRGELGRAAVVGAESEGWICGTGSLRLRILPSLATSEFIHAVLQSSPARDWLNLQSVGSTMANLNEQILGRLPIVVPPTTDEQDAVITALNSSIDGLERAVTEVDEATRLLLERRSALIAAAVTGQIDVRGAGEAQAA